MPPRVCHRSCLTGFYGVISSWRPLAPAASLVLFKISNSIWFCVLDLCSEIVFEERISLLEVFKHIIGFSDLIEGRNRKTMGCKAVYLSGQSANFLSRRDTREYQQWQPEGSSETQEAWAPATKNHERHGVKGWFINCLLQYFFSSILLFIILLHMYDCLNSSTVRTDISIFHFLLLVNSASWLALANCQFSAFLLVSLFRFAKNDPFWQKGKHPLYLFAVSSKFLPSFWRLPKPACHHDPS